MKWFFLILIIFGLMGGCGGFETSEKSRSEISKTTYCSYCSYYELSKDRIISKVCECNNYLNISYIIDFGCGEKRFQCRGLTFEDKRHMALISDHWYCICNETAIIIQCKDEEINNSPCGYEGKIYEEIENRTTEFIWSY